MQLLRDPSAVCMRSATPALSPHCSPFSVPALTSLLTDAAIAEAWFFLFFPLIAETDSASLTRAQPGSNYSLLDQEEEDKRTNSPSGMGYTQSPTQIGRSFSELVCACEAVGGDQDDRLE